MTDNREPAVGGNPRPGGLGLAVGIALAAGAAIGAIGLAFGPSTLLLELTGMPEADAAAWALGFNVALVAGLTLIARLLSKPWNILVQALVGGVFGLHVGQAMATGGGRPEFALGVDAAFAMVVGLLLVMCGLIVAAGLSSNKLAAAMEMEDSGPDRAMLKPSAVSCFSEGSLLIVLAVMTVLPAGSVALWIAALLAVALVVVDVVCHRAAWANTDEMYRRFWVEAIATGSSVFALLVVLWLIGQSLGLLPQATLLAALVLYFATYLSAAMWLMNRYYPWMIKKQTSQDLQVQP
jgi:hypothetical protein